MSPLYIRTIELLIVVVLLCFGGLGWRLRKSLPGSAQKTLAIMNISFLIVWPVLMALVLADIWFSKNAKQAFIWGITAYIAAVVIAFFYKSSWLAHRHMQAPQLSNCDQLLGIIDHARGLKATVKLRFDWSNDLLDISYAPYGKNLFKFAKTFRSSNDQLAHFNARVMGRFSSQLADEPSNIHTIIINSNGTARHTLRISY